MSCGSATVGETTYTHDDAGNLTAGTGIGTGPLGGASFDYNLPGQTETISPAGTSLPRTQAYDGVKQDRRTQDGDTSMSYGFSGLTSQATTGTSAHAELFVRDPGGKLLAMIDTTGGTVGDTRYYLTDDQDSVMATVDDTNTTSTTAVRYLYEPYGQTIRTWEDTGAGTGSTQYTEDGSASAPSNDHNPWRYVSGYHDPSTGLTKFGTRYYTPELATWTQADPKNGRTSQPTSMNSFVYAGSDPSNASDPSGRDFVGDFFEEYEFQAGMVGIASAATWGSYFSVAGAAALGVTPVGWVLAGVFAVTAITTIALAEEEHFS